MDVHPSKNVSIGIDPYPNGMKWNEMEWHGWGLKTRQQRGSARQSIHQSELHTVRHERQPRHWWMEDRWSEKWLWLRYIDMRWNDDDDDDEHKSQAHFHLFASQETHCIEKETPFDSWTGPIPCPPGVDFTGSHGAAKKYGVPWIPYIYHRYTPFMLAYIPEP